MCEKPLSYSALSGAARVHEPKAAFPDVVCSSNRTGLGRRTGAVHTHISLTHDSQEEEGDKDVKQQPHLLCTALDQVIR